MSKLSLVSTLSLAASSLLGVSGVAEAQSDVLRLSSDWEVDTSILSYSESDNRVSVSKTLANLSKRHDRSVISVNLVNDTMSGASPTGAIRSENSDVTITGASGGQGGDYFISTFDDQRKQVSVNYEQEHSGGLSFNYGATVSRESDYDSFGGNVSVAKSSADRIKTYQLGLAYTADTIFRSDTGTTPEPLANVQQRLEFSLGRRITSELLLGLSRVINRRTAAQVNLTLGQSAGYHSDPYKIISAADADDVIFDNFHDSRPESRLRSSLYTKLVHQLRGSENSIHLSYRLYQDDWGVGSHTADFSYRHVLNGQHYLEPSIRFYTQTAADFYQRNLGVDTNGNAELPADGFASADYRLDDMHSTTLGIKYGYSFTPRGQLRLRADYLNQQFSTAEFSSLTAVIVQASFSYTF